MGVCALIFPPPRCFQHFILMDIPQLPQFSESEKIKQHVVAAAPDLSSSLKDIRITHVSQEKSLLLMR